MLTGRVIFNPAAGQVATEKMIARAAQELEKYGWRAEVHASHSGAHTQELAQQAAAAELDAVFVAGGDGSIRWVVEGLLGSRTALGVLPAGTRNVWARELGLAQLTRLRRGALAHSAAALANGRVQAMDVGICGGRPFLQWAGLGLDGVIVNQMEAPRTGRRHFSMPKYLAITVWKTLSWKGLEMLIEVDGVQIGGHYLLAVMSNTRSYAGGLATISPQACLDDGEMDLWLFSGDSMRRALQHAWLLLSGQHVRSPYVQRVRFRQLRMQADIPLVAQMDGDPFEFGATLDAEVRPRALDVLLPQYAPETLFSRPGKLLG